MSIAEAVQAAITPKTCKFGTILNELAEDDASTLRNGFSAGLTASDAARILSKNGHHVGATSVKAHLANNCCCQDAA
jgi:hypothetical protein